MKIIIENDLEFKDLYIPQSGRDVEDYQEDLLNIFEVLQKWDIHSNMEYAKDGYNIKLFPQTIKIDDKVMLQFFNDLLILEKYGFKNEN
jgi:hypothetical protein